MIYDIDTCLDLEAKRYPNCLGCTKGHEGYHHYYDCNGDNYEMQKKADIERQRKRKFDDLKKKIETERKHKLAEDAFAFLYFVLTISSILAIVISVIL